MSWHLCFAHDSRWKTGSPTKSGMPTAVISLVIGLFLCQTLAWGQPIYFDSLYDPQGLSETVKNTVAIEDGYLFVANSLNPAQDTGIITLMHVNHLGEELSRIAFTTGQASFNFGTLVAHPDGEYVLFNSIRLADEAMRRFHILRYADETVTSQVIAHDIPNRKNTCWDGIICHDSGYALIGQSTDSSFTSSDIVVVRTDALGNKLWEKYYGGSSWEAGHSLCQTPDEGFLLLGWTRSYGEGERDFYLVKTDSLGNQQWQRTYGGSTDEGGKSINQLADGNYLLTGSGSQGTTMSIGKIYKVDTDGNVIWEKAYSHQNNTGNNLHKTIELWNGNLVSAGLTDLTDNGGWIICTDSLGEILWERDYNKNQYTDLFYSLLATEDGGFLLSGQAVDEETNSQDAWLLKVDSVGCAYPNCITGVDEVQPTKVMVDVWPNPVADALNIEIAGSSTQLDLHVFDISGKEMLRFTQYDKRATITTTQWNSGMYILKGTDENGRMFSLKIVKQ
jgi:hypothetical protein